MGIKNVGALDEAIRLVAPIIGVDSDGNIRFQDQATDDQRKAAQTVVDGFADVDPVASPSIENVLAVVNAALDTLQDKTVLTAQEVTDIKTPGK